MIRRLVSLCLAACMLFGGCFWQDGSYVHVTPYEQEQEDNPENVLSATDYDELLKILQDMVAAGKNGAVIYVSDAEGDTMNRDLNKARNFICTSDPIGAYAVESIAFEQGFNSGKSAISVSITYQHNASEIRRISHIADMESAQAKLQKSLQNCDAQLVMLIAEYEDTDFGQLVRNLAAEYPETVMETPKTTETVYGAGESRVVDLTFTYENSREDLRQMQAQVRTVFESAVLYVSGDGADYQKFAQLYGFLMERFEYTIETSITPAYSLLRYGIGDSRAFATVYAAMCRAAGLECQVITGTHQGEPWTWNIVWDDGVPYHVDLLTCSASDGYRERTDSEMHSYVWDYSAYKTSTDLSNGMEPEKIPEESTDSTGTNDGTASDTK